MFPSLLLKHVQRISIRSIPTRTSSLFGPTTLMPMRSNELCFSTTSQPQISLSRFKPKMPKIPSFKLIEEPAGNIIGTVNDAYVPPLPNEYHGSYHWTYEKIVTCSMVPLAIAPFVVGVEYPVLDAALGVLLLWHCHAGFQSCIIDYIPKRKFGVWHHIAMGLLTLGTCTSLYGIYVVETENSGLTSILLRLWSV